MKKERLRLHALMYSCKIVTSDDNNRYGSINMMISKGNNMRDNNRQTNNHYLL